MYKIVNMLEFILALFIIICIFKYTPIKFWLLVVGIALLIKWVLLQCNKKFIKDN